MKTSETYWRKHIAIVHFLSCRIKERKLLTWKQIYKNKMAISRWYFISTKRAHHKCWHPNQ